MQRLEVSGAVRLIYKSLGVKGLRHLGGDGGISKLIQICNALKTKINLHYV